MRRPATKSSAERRVGEAGETAVVAGGGIGGLGFEVLGEGDGAGDEQVGVFEEDDEVVALSGLRLALGADGGDGLPALFDGAANAVLVVLGEAMPERGRLAGAAGQFGDGGEERSQFLVTVGDGEAGGAVGVERPQEQREQRGPEPAGEQEQGVAEGFVPLAVGAPMPQMKMTWTRIPAEEKGWPRTAR